MTTRTKLGRAKLNKRGELLCKVSNAEIDCIQVLHKASNLE